MENFEKRNKNLLLAYELLGTALLTFCFNFTGSNKNLSTTIFLTSLWCWELSTAHFNLAITIGSFFYNLHQGSKNLFPFIMIALA